MKRFWIVSILHTGLGDTNTAMHVLASCAGFRSDNAESKGGAADRNPKWVIIGIAIVGGEFGIFSGVA